MVAPAKTAPTAPTEPEFGDINIPMLRQEAARLAQDIPDIEEIPDLIGRYQNIITANNESSVEYARRIGVLLNHAKLVLKSAGFKLWHKRNIKLSDRQRTKYMKLAFKKNFDYVTDGKGLNVFGDGEEQYPYTIDGCLDYIRAKTGKAGSRKGPKKKPDPKPKVVVVKKSKLQAAAAATGVDVDVVLETMLQAGVNIQQEDDTPKDGATNGAKPKAKK